MDRSTAVRVSLATRVQALMTGCGSIRVTVRERCGGVRAESSNAQVAPATPPPMMTAWRGSMGRWVVLAGGLHMVGEEVVEDRGAGVSLEGSGPGRDPALARARMDALDAAQRKVCERTAGRVYRSAQ